MEFRRIIHRGMNCIDVGAYKGEYSKLFKQCSQTGKIIAFEPQEKFISKLKQNKEIVCYPIGLSNKIGVARLYTGKYSSSQSGIIKQRFVSNEYKLINISTLDMKSKFQSLYLK